MKPYEAVIVFNPALSDDKVDASLAKFEKRLKDSGSTDISMEKWGTRKLSFRMKKAKKASEGIFTLIKFNSEGKAPNELNGLLKISEEVIRYSVIASRIAKNEPHEEKVEIEPSMLLQSDSPVQGEILQ